MRDFGDYVVVGVLRTRIRDLDKDVQDWMERHRTRMWWTPLAVLPFIAGLVIFLRTQGVPLSPFFVMAMLFIVPLAVWSAVRERRMGR